METNLLPMLCSFYTVSCNNLNVNILLGRSVIAYEKTIHEKRTYINFVDLEKKFDTVKWSLFIEILKDDVKFQENRSYFTELYKP